MKSANVTRRLNAFILPLVVLALGATGAESVRAQSSEDTIYLSTTGGTISFRGESERLTAIGSNNCQLDLAALTLLDIRGTGGAGPVGWSRRDKQIGVNATSSGSPCTQVRVGQGVRVGPKEPRFDLDETRVKSALITLKPSPRATVAIKTYAKCTTAEVATAGLCVNGYREVHSLSAQVLSSQQTIAIDAANAKPSVPVDKRQWDYVDIRAVTGNTSAESGSFSLVDSEFTLGFVPEGSLVCDPDDPEFQNTAIDYADDNDETSNPVIITRQRDVNAATGLPVEDDNCTPLPYRLDFDGQQAVFLADYSVLEAEGVEPAFDWRSDWDPELVPVPTDATLEYPLTEATFASTVPLSRQQFLPSPADDPYVLDLCVGTPTLDDKGTVTTDDDIVVSLELFPGVDYDMSSLDGIQYGCYLERKVVLLEDAPVACPAAVLERYPGSTATQCVPVQVDEWGYVRGDWTATRTLR